MRIHIRILWIRIYIRILPVAHPQIRSPHIRFLPESTRMTRMNGYNIYVTTTPTLTGPGDVQAEAIDGFHSSRNHEQN